MDKQVLMLCKRSSGYFDLMISKVTFEMDVYF